MRGTDDAEREQSQQWADELVKRADAIEAARQHILDVARDSGRYSALFEALDEAVAARDEWRERGQQ